MTNNNSYNIKESKIRFKLVITDKVENKIRWWCSKLPDNEWSGALFYDYKGSFKKNNLVLTAIDFLVLDIGTSGHTEFVEDEKIISYACSQGLINQQVALIHSHNRMSAFFSGEDTQTLIKEGSIRNHFLSIIVNNKGEYVAAITKKVKVESNKITIAYKTFNDADVSEIQNNVVIDEFIEKINLDIVMPKSEEELIFNKLSKSNTLALEKQKCSTGNLVKKYDYNLTLFNNNTDRSNIIQAYNRLATGTIGYVPCDRRLAFDKSFDNIAETDEETISNFVVSVTENLSAEELVELKEMLEHLDESTYIDICLGCIDANLGYYEC